jgi:hypothetical protein
MEECFHFFQSVSTICKITNNNTINLKEIRSNFQNKKSSTGESFFWLAM